MAYLPIPDITQTLEMHFIVNIATKQSLYNDYTIIILLFLCGLLSGQWPAPGPAGSGRAWAPNMTIVLRAGPGRAGVS